MNTYKKIISILLIMLLIIGSVTIMPLSVSGAGNGPLVEEGEYRAVYYADGSAMLIEANVNEEHITVPSSVGGYVITEISNAYKDNNKIKSVTIPDTITGILGCAFENCKNLESVTIPDSVTKIGGSAFEGCVSLKKVDIPDKVTEISDDAFFMCNSLKEITIPESVVEIGKHAFADCKSLATININKNPDLIIQGDAFDYSQWYNSQADGVVYLDRFALSYKGDMPDGLKVDFKDGTTSICNEIFADSEFDEDVTALIGVTFPDTLTYIGGGAFKKCVNLETVDFPESLIRIGGSAFEGCKGLKNVTIPSQVKDLRDSFMRSGIESVTLKCNPEMWSYAFYECENLKEITLPEVVEKIDLAAFYGCKALESVTLPQSVKSVEWAAFKNCENLKEINHSGNIYIVNGESFQNTAWENAQPEGFVYFGDVLMGYKGDDAANIDDLVVKDGVKGIADGAFADVNNLKRVVLPEGLKAVGAYSFRKTSVENIVIPESVEFIGYSAFAYCSNLTSLDIKGGGVIEYEAFVSCNNLKSVTVSANVEEIEDDALGKYFTMDGKLVLEGFVINGYEDSAAETYAKENGIKFVSLSADTEPVTDDKTKPSEPTENKSILGDVNGDGRVNVKDATLIQKASAKITELTDNENLCANVNGDGKVNVKDATAIQKYVAKIETGFPIGEPISG